MRLHLKLAALAMASILPSLAYGQLPNDLKSDLGENVPGFRVRPGYRVTRALPADANLRDARFLEFSEDGKTLYLSQIQEGKILALTDPDSNGVYRKTTTFVKDKRSVQGMCAHGGWLYFSQAREGSVSRARDTNGDGVADDVEVILPAKSVPAGGGHPFEGLLVTDKEIYITSSDPQNMTPVPSKPNSDQPERKTIYVFDIDGKNKRVFCTGIRNTEKLRFRPGTSEIWGFDHGSDNFGGTFGETMNSNQPITDLNPPEELNRYVQDGFYGHPFITGNRIPRPEFADRKDIVELAAKTIVPEWLVGAHWSPLGFTFINSDYFGAEMKGDCLLAAHGSWNSSNAVGACVQRIMFDQVTGRPIGSMTLVDCVSSANNRRVARPVDCAEAPDGSILFTSDEPAALYRITKSEKK